MSQQAMIQAVQAGDRGQIEALLMQDPGLVNARTEGGLPVVLLALYDGQTEIAALLVERGAALDVFSAAALGHMERLEELVSSQPDLIHTVSVDGFQPLGLASFFGRYQAARYLVEKGAQVNSASHNPMRVMPLHSAVAGGHEEIARLLLAHGADPNARQADEFAPLHGAAQNGQVEMIRLLLQHGADPSATSAGEKTLLDFARENGNVEALRLVESL